MGRQNKFGRNYQLLIETQTGETVTFTPPITLEFDIIRNTLSSANAGQFRLFNLSPKNRDALYFNSYDTGNYKQVFLKAGYGDTLTTIFQGNVHACWSVREGVNYITTIECYDGGFAFVNGDVNVNIPSGTPQTEVYSTLISNMPRLDVGKIGNYIGITTRGNAYIGNAAKILGELSGGGFFVDGEKGNVLKDSEYIQTVGDIILIDSATGLLNTPIVERNLIRFEMLFEPSLNIGHLVLVNSSTAKQFNKYYKLTSVKHRGMISGAVAGSAITIGECFYSKDFTPVL